MASLEWSILSKNIHGVSQTRWNNFLLQETHADTHFCVFSTQSYPNISLDTQKEDVDDNELLSWSAPENF